MAPRGTPGPLDPLDVARDVRTAATTSRPRRPAAVALALQLAAQVVAVRAALDRVELALQLAAEVDPVRQRDGVVCR